MEGYADRVIPHIPGEMTVERSHRFNRTLTHRIAGRFLDIIVSVSVLALLAPLMLLIALAVRLDSPGPVFFRHVRIGMNRRNGMDRRRDHAGSQLDRERRSTIGSDRRLIDGCGKPFTLYKFRTMYVDARKRFPDLYAYKYSDEELYTLPIKLLVGSKRDPETVEGPIELESTNATDPRITRIGRLLRRTSLDELPNFWNVLKGDMHLVGPRPDIAENIRYYPPRQMKKLLVKPGITGLAQVEGRGNLSFHETNELDIEYVERQSLWLDIKIFFKTIWIILTREGAM